MNFKNQSLIEIVIMAKLTISFMLVFIFQIVHAEELHCSKYDFEEKVLEKMIRMEFKMERQKVELAEALQTIVDASNTVDAKIREFDKVIETYGAELRTNFSNQNERIDSMLGKKVEEIKLMQENLPALKLAFRAVQKSNTDVRTGNTIVFSEVLHNDGGYDPNSGIFTATVNGTYIFTVRLCPYNQKYVRFSFKVDGTEQDATSFYGDAGHTCYSAETVIMLNREQKVWLYVKYAYSDSAISGDAYRWNTFTGLVF